MIQVCPINERVINSQGVQINAFLVFLFLTTYFVYPSIYILWFLVIEFSLKVFLKKSPLSVVSNKICWKKNMINSAPKEFANKIGLFFVISLTTLYYLDLNMIFNILYFIFLAAVALEAFFSFCVGCLFYSFLKK